MRPVSTEHGISQGFASMPTAGVAPSWTPATVGWYVRLYGNYQPFGHAGMDFACPIGTKVYAMADGVVLYAGWGYNLPGTGNVRKWLLYKDFPGIVTVIQHPGWIGVYAHLSDNDMAPAGTRVKEGQLIALSGATGGVAPHLHVEALVDLTYKTGGGLIYGRTDPSKFFGGLAAQGSITQEDELASSVDIIVAESNKQAVETRKQIVEALRLAVGAIAQNDQAIEDVTREFLKDRIAEASPEELAAKIPESIAQQVVDLLTERLAK